MARKPKPKPSTVAPDKPEGTGSDHDPATGRFVCGNRANPAGRPRGFDFRAIVTKARSSEGVDEDLRTVWNSLVAEAKAGNVAAMKLILDRMCTTDPDAPMTPNDLAQTALEVADLMRRAQARQAEGQP